jgi:Na+/melibiose symporter-like transporter
MPELRRQEKRVGLHSVLFRKASVVAKRLLVRFSRKTGSYCESRANLVQPLHVQTGIRYMMSFCPALAGFLSAAVVLLYKLDDTTMVRIERDLRRRRPLPP